jgi:hypothetical protein
MSEHTSGPWFVHDFDVTVSCDHPAAITICTMGHALTGTLEEANANVRLIAAAPEMYAEIVAIARWFQCLEDENIEHVQMRYPEPVTAAVRKVHAYPHLAALRAIISKVEGHGG